MKLAEIAILSVLSLLAWTQWQGGSSIGMTPSLAVPGSALSSVCGNTVQLKQKM